MINIIPGTGSADDLKGTGQADEFDLDAGGDDKARGLGGDDVFFMGASLTPDDHLFGGAGFDTVELQGEGASFFAFTSATFDSIEQIKLFGANDYNLSLDDTVVAAGETMTIDTTTSSAGHFAAVNAFAETNGRYILKGGAGSDQVHTGAGNDVLYGGDGFDQLEPGTGTDKVYGGGGSDVIIFQAGALDGNDRIEGGEGVDTVSFSGDITITKAMFLGVEDASISGAGHSNVDLTHVNMSGISHFFVDAQSSGGGVTCTVAGKNLPVTMTGSGSDDVLIGGAGENTFLGLGGADTMTGGGQKDVYYLTITGGVNGSTGPAFDTINGFDTADDRFARQIGGSVLNPAAIDDDVKGGRLSADHFNHDLASAIGADDLGANDAVLFRPGSGTYKGEWFVIVDANGTAGYQTGADFVVHLHNPHDLVDFGAGNFGT